MRILMFGWEFPPHISGGLGTACAGICNALTDIGHDILFLVPRMWGNGEGGRLTLLSAADFLDARPANARGLSSGEITFTAIPSALRPYIREENYRSLIRGIGPRGGRTGRDLFGGYGPDLMSEVWRYAEAAASIADGERFHVIHSHDWTTVLAAERAKKISGRPWIYHAHALEFDRSGEHINRVIYDLEKYGLEMADHVIAVSHYTRDMIVKRYGVGSEKVTVVHNAVSQSESAERARIQRDPEERTVLFLGRITMQKGPEYFIEAAAMVLKALPRVRFVMAGTGDMLTRMIEKVAELNIGRHFHFPGFLRGAEVDRMYAMSDLYVMPSVSEPFGISPLEAMLYDVPVIISRQSGVGEILHHAIKVDFWDVKKLADKMIALLTYPVVTHEMTEHAHEELRGIRWEHAARKIDSLYRQVLAKA